jgi:isoleucyl-tRNA synthetase
VQIVYLPQKEIEDRLLSAQIIDTEKAGTTNPLATELERQLANPDEAQLDIWDVEAEIATGTKCNRCWRNVPEVSNYGIWQNVCTRCQNALTEMKIAPPDVT